MVLALAAVACGQTVETATPSPTETATPTPTPTPTPSAVLGFVDALPIDGGGDINGVTTIVAPAPPDGSEVVGWVADAALPDDRLAPGLAAAEVVAAFHEFVLAHTTDEPFAVDVQRRVSSGGQVDQTTVRSPDGAAAFVLVIDPQGIIIAAGEES